MFTAIQSCSPRPRARRRIAALGVGEYFGEDTCFFGDKRDATAVATSLCELYSLSSSALELVVSNWPELGDDLAQLGRWLFSYQPGRTSQAGLPSNPKLQPVNPSLGQIWWARVFHGG